MKPERVFKLKNILFPKYTGRWAVARMFSHILCVCQSPELQKQQASLSTMFTLMSLSNSTADIKPNAEIRPKSPVQHSHYWHFSHQFDLPPNRTRLLLGH
jgi:hypothetical protein